MRSADNLNSPRWNSKPEHGHILPPFVEETKGGRSSPANWATRNNDMVLDEASSKWIHRDKLARIESEELHAAGFVIPKGRSSSRLRRDRSESRQGQGESERGSRPRQDSATLEVMEPLSSAPSWDLRTPEEIAEAEANAYFMSTGAGGSLIPVAKSSPAPISLDFLEKGSSAARRYESADDDSLSYAKTRSRSASASYRDTDYSSSAGGARMGKRSVTDTSPRKAGARKLSTASSRPGTRSGPNKESPSRPATRSGRKASRAKHPEGEPPWMANTYKPDPRLPPDQQIPGVVAKRLAQEQLEKDGVFGDAYDKDFRPLNNNALRNPTGDGQATGYEEWPLKPAVTTSPLLRNGSLYSTMPKISDKPPASPIPSPRPQMPSPPLAQQSQMQTLQVQEDVVEDKKGGCGCCVVM